VAVLRVPYHLDEYLPDLDTLLEAQQEIAPVLPAGDVWARLAVLYSAVGQAVADSARRGSVPVVVSGDCTTSLGIVAGLQQDGADPAIVWFDAHGDVQTLETTTSGYPGGLPLRLLMGYRPKLIGARLGLRPDIKRLPIFGLGCVAGAAALARAVPRPPGAGPAEGAGGGGGHIGT